jgi:phosphate transport system protein
MHMTRERYDAMLGDLKRQIIEMGHRTASTIGASIHTLDHQDITAAHQLIDEDSEIDSLRHSIEVRAFELIATQQPAAHDLRVATSAMAIAAELERIADYSEGIAKLTLRLAAEPMTVSLDAIQTMAGLTQSQLGSVLRAYEAEDVTVAGDVWIQDAAIDDRYEDIFRLLIGRMAETPSSVRRGTYLLWVAHNIERMADRITNIAESVAFMATGDVPTFRQALRERTLPV